MREENQHLATQLEQKELLLKQLGEDIENLLAEKAAGIQTGIATGARKRETRAAAGGNRTGFSGSMEEMDAAEENEWRQRPLRVSVKEQEITREELTATVLQKYLQNNQPEFEQLEIRHSEEGEQLHGRGRETVLCLSVF